MSARPSPFHVRTAEHNVGNAWVRRGAFTLAARYGDAHQEALAARAAVVLIDASFMTRLRVHGPGAARLLSAACAFDAEALPAGSSRQVFWRTDGGGVRGIGVAGRFAPANFVLRGMESDGAWFDAAAKRFETTIRDETTEKGLLFLFGPMATELLAAAGLREAARLEPSQHAVVSWRGLNVTVSRWSTLAQSLGGYEISCANEDAIAVFDRLWRVGRDFGLAPAGQEALDTLLLEQGVLVPHADFEPARESKAREPAPSSLGLTDGGEGARLLTGLEFDSEEPMAHAPVMQGGRVIGATLRSAYSPVLRRAIALAQLEPAYASVGTTATVRRLTSSGNVDAVARVSALPFVARQQKSKLEA